MSNLLDEDMFSEDDSFDEQILSIDFEEFVNQSRNSQSSATFQSADETFAFDFSNEIASNQIPYQQFLTEKASNFMTIEQLIRDTPNLLTNASGTSINIYGIMNEVYDLRSESNAYDPFEVKDKYVNLVDPSCDSALRVRLDKPYFYFEVGDILRIQNLQFVQGLNTVEYFCEKKDDLHQIRCLEFDYKLGEVKKDCHCNIEQEISRYLEIWYANKILRECRLNKLPSPKLQEPHYVNIVCQVLSKQILQQSMVMRIFDGTTPNRLFNYDETVAYINALKPINPIESSVYSDKSLKMHESANPQKMSKCAIINVWGNESGLHCYHLNTAKTLKLTEGKDLLLFLNVEVRQIMDGPLALLVMRSGRHKGKAVRVVRKESIMGAMFTKAIGEQRESTTQNVFSTAEQ